MRPASQASDTIELGLPVLCVRSLRLAGRVSGALISAVGGFVLLVGSGAFLAAAGIMR